MYTYHKWNVTVKFLMDAESNDPVMDAKIATYDSVNLIWVPLATQPSFFNVITAVMGDLYIEFNQPPQPPGIPGDNDEEIYNIWMTMWD
jgi:hypothetical protein